jgi:hypothetical protein
MEDKKMKQSSREAAAFALTVVISLLAGWSHARAQHGPLPSWKALADESSAVVVADIVEGNIQVIDPLKKTKVDTGPDGKLSFGNPALYTVGVLCTAKAVGLIKGDGRIVAGGITRVFIHGYYGLDLPPIPQPKERYVFFLRLLDENDKELSTAVVQRIQRTQEGGHPDYIEHREKFDPKGCYTPVEGGYAEVLVAPDKPYMVDNIKQAIAKGP